LAISIVGVEHQLPLEVVAALLKEHRRSEDFDRVVATMASS